MSNNNYCVPSLSLSSSRSKKYIPTKDTIEKNLSANPYRNQYNKINQDLNLREKNDQKSNYSKNSLSGLSCNIPKPRVNQQRPPIFSKNEIKQINRDVYLKKQQNANNYNDYSTQNKNHQQGVDYYKQERGQYLLRNPESRYQVKQQINQLTSNIEFKKVDVNKVLFERRINKLIQQAKFYDQQLDSCYQQLCKNEIQQLENIAKKSIQDHQQILQSLNALTF